MTFFDKMTFLHDDQMTDIFGYDKMTFLLILW